MSPFSGPIRRCGFVGVGVTVLKEVETGVEVSYVQAMPSVGLRLLLLPQDQSA